MRLKGRSDRRSVAASGLLFLALILLSVASQAQPERERRITLDLSEVPLPQAMGLLAKRAGIEIRIEESVRKTVSSVYTNETIEKVVSSMLKDLNHVSIWDYRRNELDSISIWVYEESVSPPRIQTERISKLVLSAVKSETPTQPRLSAAAAAGSRTPRIPDSAKNAPLSVPSSTKGGGGSSARTAEEPEGEDVDSPSSGLSSTEENTSAATSSSDGTTASAGEEASTASAGTTSGGGAGGLSQEEQEEEVTPVEDAGESFRMAILQAFSVGDHEVLASGVVEAGVVRTGDRIKIIGTAQSPIHATVLQVKISGETVDQAAAGDVASLLLSGVGSASILGGTLVAASSEEDADSPGAYGSFEAVLFVLMKDLLLFNEAFSQGGVLEFAFEGATVTGSGVFTGETSEVEVTGETGGYALISATLSSPVVMEPGVWFDVTLGEGATASGRVILVLE